MKNCYEVMDNTNTITNGTYSIRWTGSKTSPQFVGQDIARGIGYKYARSMYVRFDTSEYVDAERGKKGRILMRSLSIAQVTEALSFKDKRLDETRDAFREFWEDYVLPEFDSRWAKIAAQKREIARLKAENAILASDLCKANDTIISIKSLVA